MADFLVDHGIDHLFTVVGGGAMFLNDSFGHKEGLSVTYHHHEQAAAMAAEGFSRFRNKPAAVCITTGPGGTNALTGCLCAYTGSIPVLFISGQVRYDTSIPSTGLDIRIMGVQEFQIINAVKSLTKFAVTVTEPMDIRYYLEKALYIATHGRPGPVWLDIPLNVQTAVIETTNLKGFVEQEYERELTGPISDDVIDNVYEKLIHAKRPVLLVGKGMRLSGGLEEFYELVHHLQIPVVNGMSSVDAMPTGDPMLIGHAGLTGDRAGNLAMQNSDLLISIGSRLSFTMIGYNVKTWAREAYRVAVDIDPEELKKPFLNIDLPICGDAKEFVEKLNLRVGHGYENNTERSSWLETCRGWKEKYPVVTPEHFSKPGGVNLYAFYKVLTDLLGPNAVIVTSAGTARVVGSQASFIKPGQRYINNSSTASMGYGLPAAIGTCIANEKKPVICVTGDGSFQMNIQELQTIKQNNLPVKIFVINNEGYHSIRTTQNAYFPNRSHVGIGEESGDLSFPDLSKIAVAYSYTYFHCEKNEDLQEVISACLSEEKYLICELKISINQNVEPKAASKKLPNGKFVSAPLEDMAPFLPREELEQNMFIPPVDEE